MPALRVQIPQVSYALVPWDLEKNAVEVDSKLLQVKANHLRPHPEDPSKSVYTTLEINRMGGFMPRWAFGMLLSATASHMMTSLEKRYIANIRNKGLTVDMTTEAARQRAISALS